MLKLFAGLDRLGPGNADSLHWVLDLVELKPTAVVLDAGCGVGADLGVLAAAVPHGRVVAMDEVAAFVERVRARYPEVETHLGDFIDPPGGPFDLIWSAGAVTSAGVGRVLTAWRDHLAAGGCVGFSHLCARSPDMPDEVRDFWTVEGIVLRDAPALDDEVNAAGYEVLGGHWLSTAGWAAYYGPLEENLDHVGDSDPAFVRCMRAEIALWRRHGVSYGYRIIVARPA